MHLDYFKSSFLWVECLKTAVFHVNNIDISVIFKDRVNLSPDSNGPQKTNIKTAQIQTKIILVVSYINRFIFLLFLFIYFFMALWVTKSIQKYINFASWFFLLLTVYLLGSVSKFQAR